MRNILLVSTLENFPGINVIPLCILSSVLKKDGNNVKLLDCSEELSPAAIKKSALLFSPDVIGINVMTSHQLTTFKRVSLLLKELFNVPIIAGGIAVSTDPETYISNPSIDAICIGEGEQVILDILENLSDIQKWSVIQNLWVKYENHRGEYRIVRNSVRPLIENLNELPLIDLSLFRESLEKYKQPYIALMANRGCPYECAYCANVNYKKLFPNYDKYVRYRDPALVVNEMIVAKQLFASRYIYFEDDAFTINRSWLANFTNSLSKSNFFHPFSINIRLDRVDIDSIVELIKFGLDSVRFGLETGDEQYRHEVLRRNDNNDNYLKNADRLRKLKLKLISYNMIGLPFEREAMIKKTIEINSKLMVNESRYQTFKPFKGTPLREFVEKENLIILEPEQCSNGSRSNADLFILTNCSQRIYYSYFISFKIVRSLLHIFVCLKNYPNVTYYLTILFKIISSIIPTKILYFMFSIRCTYKHRFKKFSYKWK